MPSSRSSNCLYCAPLNSVMSIPICLLTSGDNFSAGSRHSSESQSCTVDFPLAVHLCPSTSLFVLVTQSTAMNVTSSVLTREKLYQRRARKDLNKTPLLLLPNYHRPLHEPCGHKLSHQSSNAPTLLECGPTGDWNRSREKCWTAPRSCGSCLQNDSVKQLRSFKTLIEFKN